jgi:hypothetical protein
MVLPFLIADIELRGGAKLYMASEVLMRFQGVSSSHRPKNITIQDDSSKTYSHNPVYRYPDHSYIPVSEVMDEINLEYNEKPPSIVIFNIKQDVNTIHLN